jgi:hypothetical protein
MLKIEKTVLPSPEQWEIVIEGLRNPMNSWDKMDSKFVRYASDERFEEPVTIGEADHKLMMSLNKGGTEHSKYRRMIPVGVTINAPLYWWKEADTYTVGKVQNSCSTMHKIHSKEFALDDFSHEHMYEGSIDHLCGLIRWLNLCREVYLDEKDKNHWWQMIQLLPASYNQKRTVMLNYEVLAKMYRERKNHKLDEWHTFCDWIKTLPYSELITMENTDE